MQAKSKLCDNAFGKAVSASSSSPGAAPTREMRPYQGGCVPESKAVVSPHARAMFTYAVTRNEEVNHVISSGCNGAGLTNAKSWMLPGPYMLMHPIGNDDILLINYIFMGGKKVTVEEGRLAHKLDGVVIFICSSVK